VQVARALVVDDQILFGLGDDELVAPRNGTHDMSDPSIRMKKCQNPP
jgi:hypothetical protein